MKSAWYGLCVVVMVASTFGQESGARRVVPYPIFEMSGWQKALTARTRTTNGVPGDRSWTNHGSYEIEVELDPASAMLTGTVKMTYRNRSPRRLRDLKIHLRQNLHKAGALRNRRAEVTGGMTISKVKCGGREVKATGRRRYRIAGSILTVPLTTPLELGGEVTVSMDYSFRVPKAGQAPRMGHENHHVYYLGYWYPQFAVYDDVRGWVADNYMGNGEFYMDYADYDVKFTAPHGWIVSATGTLENAGKVLTSKAMKRLAQARKSRDVVAVVTKKEWGPGRATRRAGSGRLTWHFSAQNVRDFAVSLSDRYVWDATHAVVKDREGPGQDGVAMIHAVYEPGTGSWARAAEFSRFTIEYMSELLYPYPWPHMTACEGIIGGGMEYPMMTIIGGRGSAQSLFGVVSHELIHMWFPMIVGQDEKRFAWMDEGLTSFFTSLAREVFWQSGGASRRVYTSYRMVAKSGREFPCMQHADTYSVGGFGFASYGKVAAVMHQLRGYLGKETFMKAMRAYTQRWAYRHPYPYDLFNTFSDVTGRDLDWYFRTWMYETWTLDQSVKSVTPADNGTIIVITDKGPATGPTTVEIEYAGGKKERRQIPVDYWLGGPTTHRLEVGANVTSVTVDPDGLTLDVAPKNNSWSSKGGRN